MGSALNPYASPTEEASRRLRTDQSQRVALRRIRLATAIGGVAPVTGLSLVIVRALHEASPWSELSFFWVLEATFGVVGVGLWFVAGWFLVYPTVQLVSRFIRFIFARGTALQPWRVARGDALWTLPYVAALGAATWLAISLSGLGGWPYGVILGALFHALAAWVYITPIVYWFQAVRESRRGRVETATSAR